MADDPERTSESTPAREAATDETAELRARVLMLEGELNRMRDEMARLNRETRERTSDRRRARSETRDRVEDVREIVERVDGEGRRLFRALVLSQVEQLRLTADLVGSFAERIERDNRPDDPDLERDLPRDVIDGLLDTIDRSLDIPERTIERFEETYKQAPRTRRARDERTG